MPNTALITTETPAMIAVIWNACWAYGSRSASKKKVSPGWKVR